MNLRIPIYMQRFHKDTNSLMIVRMRTTNAAMTTRVKIIYHSSMRMKMMRRKPKYKKITLMYNIMDYKEPKKRVTKNDKKNKRQVYSQKHVRNLLKQKEASLAKKNNGPLHSTDHPLLPNGRV